MTRMSPATRTVLMVAWPAFLMAAVLEAAVFAFVDPHALIGPGGAPLELSATAVCSIAFLLFWAVIAAAGALGHWLSHPPRRARKLRKLRAVRLQPR